MEVIYTQKDLEKLLSYAFEGCHWDYQKQRYIANDNNPVCVHCYSCMEDCRTCILTKIAWLIKDNSFEILQQLLKEDKNDN